MLRRYYDAQNGAGFDYAYRYPGMNKVLQAAGRVIRTPEAVSYTHLFWKRWRPALSSRAPRSKACGPAGST